MARRLVDRLARALRTAGPSTEQVHFHSGPDGRPYACHDVLCASPSLDVDLG